MSSTFSSPRQQGTSACVCGEACCREGAVGQGGSNNVRPTSPVPVTITSSQFDYASLTIASSLEFFAASTSPTEVGSIGSDSNAIIPRASSPSRSTAQPPAPLDVTRTPSPEPRSPGYCRPQVVAFASPRPLAFQTVLSPTPESPVTERRDRGAGGAVTTTKVGNRFTFQSPLASPQKTDAGSSVCEEKGFLGEEVNTEVIVLDEVHAKSDHNGEKLVLVFCESEWGTNVKVCADKSQGRGREKTCTEKIAARTDDEDGHKQRLGSTSQSSLQVQDLNASPGMSIRRKILPHKRKLKRGMTCDTILFRPPPQFVPLPRRRSSGTVSSSSEGETEHEPSPPVARRGRRAAIYETKNCGDVSPATLSPEHSPSNSCDEGEAGSNIAERLRRRRSSVDLAMNIYPGDLVVQEHHKKLIKRNTIADFYARPAGDGAAGSTSEDVSKKGRQPFSILKLMKTRSKENLSRLDDILRRLKPSEFKDNHLAAYKNVHWSDLIASTDKQSPPIAISEMERKRREAVWELFKSECVFLIDHCMVLKHCFMEPLKKVQVEGSLMYAEPQDIFGNLDELCYVSYTFCKDFIAALLKDMSASDFGRTKVLIKAFQRFSTHSKDGAVYHTYCINYINALSYLEKLRQNSEFVEFERWCEQDGRCNRLQLADLLVAPVQHCTKLPLLLANIRKYTESEQERLLVTESIEKTELSLQQLEEKMKWIRNVERVQEIQRQIVWPSVAELDPRCQIPDCLKSTLAKQPCERLLSCTKRQLLHEGPLTLMETPKPIEVHVFLFEDLLLITKLKKMARKQKQGGEVGAKSPSGTTADRSSYIVFRQPLALDRFLVHDIAPTDASASGMKNLFVLVHISRFQQIIGLFSLQAASDPAKGQWVTLIREAKEKFAESQSCRQDSFKENKDPRAGGPGTEGGEQESSTDPVLSRRTHNNNLSRKVPSKSRSMDAVFV